MKSDRTTRFYDLIWPERAMVLRLAMVLTGNSAEAEDLAQDTLLKAFSALDQFRENTDIKAWLTTILRNTRIDRLRAKGTAQRELSMEELELEPADTHTPDESWANPQELLDSFSDHQIIQALQNLPEEIRWTLLLVDVEGWDQQMAAEHLAVPVGTIKSRLHRGRGMLRDALSVTRATRPELRRD